MTKTKDWDRGRKMQSNVIKDFIQEHNLTVKQFAVIIHSKENYVRQMMQTPGRFMVRHIIYISDHFGYSLEECYEMFVKPLDTSYSLKYEYEIPEPEAEPEREPEQSTEEIPEEVNQTEHNE